VWKEISDLWNLAFKYKYVHTHTHTHTTCTNIHTHYCFFRMYTYVEECMSRWVDVCEEVSGLFDLCMSRQIHTHIHIPFLSSRPSYESDFPYYPCKQAIHIHTHTHTYGSTTPTDRHHFLHVHPAFFLPYIHTHTLSLSLSLSHTLTHQTHTKEITHLHANIQACTFTTTTANIFHC
jgi:hypothetical protein